MMNIAHSKLIWLGLAVCLTSTIVPEWMYAQDRNPFIVTHRPTDSESEGVTSESSDVDVEYLRMKFASMQKELLDKDRQLERMQKAINETNAKLDKSEESFLSQKEKVEDLRAGGKELVKNIHDLNTLVRRQQKDLKSAQQSAYKAQEAAETCKMNSRYKALCYWNEREKLTH